MQVISYYGLSKNLFQKNIEKEELFEGESYQEGISRLKYLKEIKGIGLITGVAGVGKTTLLRSFMESLNKEKYNRLVRKPKSVI